MKKVIIDTTIGSTKHMVFSDIFKNEYEVTVFENKKKYGTPFAEDAFLPVIEGRISDTKNYWKAKESLEPVIFGTIQKGFVKSGAIWQLAAMVAIEKDNKAYAHFAQSIPVIGLTDEIMGKRAPIVLEELKKLYPGFQEIGLVSLLIPGETEENWLKKALSTLRINSGI